MKIRLTIDFDSVKEYEIFKQRQLDLDGVTTEVKVEAPAPVKAQEKKTAEKAKKTNETEPSFTSVTKEDECPFNEGRTASELKALLIEKAKDGKRAEVKSFLNKHGAEKLPELVEKDDIDIDALYSEAEVI